MWLRIAKKDSGIHSITIPQTLDVALCYGWIDSHRKGFNEAYYLQRYSPRRLKSPWSMVNVRKVGVLMKTGRMKAHGYAEIRRAQEDGRWDVAHESQKCATIPADLAAALVQHEQAQKAFSQLDKRSQYAILLPLLKATSAKSRATLLMISIVGSYCGYCACSISARAPTAASSCKDSVFSIKVCPASVNTCCIAIVLCTA
ncbi:YdeI/OmpD-associated family protein [Paenibacillus sp. RC67]|uniref:YdeI/OmpD-associated family protein n=1 Tax=Paenibacillus sp. RC67 TaxID=3039392 RepID=UPI0024ACB5FB|nr:YdeI/OmpD-associated family protein [Paenibacillus sp. RC67]